jgi:uncharacterized membrane protein YqhA
MTLFISKLLSKSRYLVGLAVLGAFVGMVALLLYGVWDVYHLVSTVLAAQEYEGIGKKLTFGFVEAIDTFLLATVCYITALGLYELFIDDQVELPNWLNIRNLDDLKNKLTSVIIVLMAVIFLGHVVRFIADWGANRPRHRSTDLVFTPKRLFPLAIALRTFWWASYGLHSVFDDAKRRRTCNSHNAGRWYLNLG